MVYFLFLSNFLFFSATENTLKGTGNLLTVPYKAVSGTTLRKQLETDPH